MITFRHTDERFSKPFNVEYGDLVRLGKVFDFYQRNMNDMWSAKGTRPSDMNTAYAVCEYLARIKLKIMPLPLERILDAWVGTNKYTVTRYMLDPIKKTTIAYKCIQNKTHPQTITARKYMRWFIEFCLKKGVM